MDDQTKAFVAAEAARAAEELGVKDDTPNVTAPEPTVEPAQPAAPQPGTVVQPETTPPPEVQPGPQAAEQPPTTPPVEEDDEPDIPTFFNPWAPPAAPQATPQDVAPQQPVAPQAPVVPQQVPQLDPSQFSDQYGNVDMAKFTQAMQARDAALAAQVRQSITGDLTNQITQNVLKQAVEQAARVSSEQVMAAKAEERAWERTFEKYPQVKASKDLRDQIHKMRIGEVATTGKNVSPLKVAERYFAQMALARQEGVNQATTQTQVQAVAHLETADNTASERGLKAQQDWSKIDSRDRREAEASRTSLLKQMIADGKL